jgi:serine/threonine protein phosphatase PrpC
MPGAGPGVPSYGDPNAQPGLGPQPGHGRGGMFNRGDNEARKERERAKKLERDLQDANARITQLQRERDSARGELDQEQRMRKLAEGRLQFLQEHMKDGRIVQPDPPESDPPDYEAEKHLHPKVRIFPEPGKTAKLASGWHLAGASVRGRSHKAGKFRDDEFTVRLVGPDKIALVAIADGVGSKEFSRKGAYAAVHGAVDSVKEEQMRDLVNAVLKNQDPQEAEITALAQKMILGMLDSAYQAVHKAADENGKHPDDLHSTLLVYVVIPKKEDLFVASAQVGDGALLAWHPTPPDVEAADLNFLQQPQFTGVDNRVVPFLRFNRSEWKNLIKVNTVEKGQVLLGMTDGTIDDLSTPADEVTGHFASFADFYAKLKKEALDTAEPGKGMAAFLEYRKRASGDDRTVICIY